MKTTQVQDIPQLQPPGAGLPLAQRIALKYWLGPVVSKRTPREQSRKTYEALVAKLMALVQKVPVDQRDEKVLVDPIVGLEDSSRFWSLNEVLEHLLIVGRGMEQVILSLAAGKVPPGEASIAAVKPGKAQGSQLEEFMSYAPGLAARLDEQMARPGMSFDSPVRFRHPWFGPITARQWYWLMATHQGIHYKQAKQIASKLKAV